MTNACVQRAGLAQAGATVQWDNETRKLKNKWKILSKNIGSFLKRISQN